MVVGAHNEACDITVEVGIVAKSCSHGVDLLWCSVCYGGRWAVGALMEFLVVFVVAALDKRAN